MDVERMRCTAAVVIDGPFLSVADLHRLIDRMLTKLLTIDRVFGRRIRRIRAPCHVGRDGRIRRGLEVELTFLFWVAGKLKVREESRHIKIGRASCRER